ncbi:MAG TPA: hypothetical protein VJZ76_11945 [Thermoanaerobaculia bacterium]|nr:hypothetical protein [Thermoanaerobaculia bacterium]
MERQVVDRLRDFYGAPRCDACVIRSHCDFYSNLMARARVTTRER